MLLATGCQVVCPEPLGYCNSPIQPSWERPWRVARYEPAATSGHCRVHSGVKAFSLVQWVVPVLRTVVPLGPCRYSGCSCTLQRHPPFGRRPRSPSFPPSPASSQHHSLLFYLCLASPRPSVFFAVFYSSSARLDAITFASILGPLQGSLWRHLCETALFRMAR